MIAFTCNAPREEVGEQTKAVGEGERPRLRNLPPFLLLLSFPCGAGEQNSKLDGGEGGTVRGMHRKLLGCTLGVDETL